MSIQLSNEWCYMKFFKYVGYSKYGMSGKKAHLCGIPTVIDFNHQENQKKMKENFHCNTHDTAISTSLPKNMFL